MQARITAIDRVNLINEVTTAAPASGLSIGLAAVRLGLLRVLRRFFVPYRPNPT